MEYAVDENEHGFIVSTLAVAGYRWVIGPDAAPKAMIAGLFAVCFCWRFFIALGRPKTIPDFGGRHTAIRNMSELNLLLEAAERKQAKPVLVECYAHWCKKCRMAAPGYARLSHEYDCIFATVNIDKARDIARHLKVRSRPTFVLFLGRVEVGTCNGWSESRLRALLDENGVNEREDENSSDAMRRLRGKM